MTLIAAPPTTIPRRIVEDRGTWAMLMFVATEATLFVAMFFAYYYLGYHQATWPPEPPEYTLALVMLAILLTSSGVLWWGEKRMEEGRRHLARRATLVTVLLGCLFIAVQVKEYANHLKKLLPTTNAYGSIFYTITSLHACHVLLGMLMLVYVLLLPDAGPGEKPPHRPLHNAALYWHFVDVVWIFIVTLLYVTPNLQQ